MCYNALMDEAKIIKAIKQYHGNVSKVALSVGLSRTTIYERINNSNIIKEALDDARENRNGEVTDALYEEAVDNRNIAALIFIAKTQMGWKEVNRVEHDIGYHVTIDD